MLPTRYCQTRKASRVRRSASVSTVQQSGRSQLAPRGGLVGRCSHRFHCEHGGRNAAQSRRHQRSRYPDYGSSINCSDQASCPYVALGSGGSLTLQFVDNVLTGSGDSSPDLWVFEVGSDVEDTSVEISKDGTNCTSVGQVFGDTARIEIDAFGFDTTDLFTHIRLTDDPTEGSHNGATAGADIDAVGAISTIAVSVPESSTMALLVFGLLRARCAGKRRRRFAVHPRRR